MNTPTRLAACVLGAALLAGCAPPRSRASSAAQAACRQEVDRVYSAQNRVDLSTRDQRDSPFAGSYLSGVPSRGLGAEYGRENMVSSCLANSSDASAGATRAGTGTGSGAGDGTGAGSPFSPASR